MHRTPEFFLKCSTGGRFTNRKIIPTLLILILSIGVCLSLLAGTVAADDWVGGLPLTTIQTGTVTGDLYISGNPPSSTFSTVVDRTFTLPTAAVAESGRVKWARLYVSSYCGHMQDAKKITYTTKVDWNNDGTWDNTWAEADAGQKFTYIVDGGNDNSEFTGHSTGEPYLMLNDHTNRVTSDYLSWYDVTNLIKVGQPTIKVNVNATGSYDGRIKVVELVVAYDDPASTTQTQYWVNEGHDSCSYYPEDSNAVVSIGSTTFDTTGVTGITSATLTADYMASSNGYYGFPTTANSFDGNSGSTAVTGSFNSALDNTGATQGPYSGLKSWDVTSSITGTGPVTLGYARDITVTSGNGMFYKIPLAFLVVKKPLQSNSAPNADFTTNVTSGTAPLTVQFNDNSTGSPTSWQWDFNNDGTIDSTSQSPSYTYSNAGTYTVNLTVTGPGGSDSEVKIGYIAVNTSSSATPTNDLNITGTVNPIASTVFAREANTVSVNSVKNTGSATLTNISVALYASDVSSSIPVNRTTIASLASGKTATATIIDPTIRNLEGSTVTYTAVVDPDDLIPETSETNNSKKSTAKSVKYNGYKGKGIYWEGGSNITTKHTYDLQGNLLYSTQPESVYKGVGWTTQTETWSASDLPVPSGSIIEKAFLYFAYNWDQTPGGYPWLNLNFNGYTLDNGNLSTGNGTLYRDWSNFGSYADYEYGLCVYDVTDKFSLSGNSLATNPYDSSYNKVALYPSTLVVIYRNSNETRKQILINEECDELGFSDSSYATTPEEATAYAPFTGLSIDKANVTKATLYSFAGSAGPDEGNLLFNGNNVATNAWMGTASTSSPLVFNATNYLTESENVFGIQSTTSGGMDTLQQILVVEYPGETISAPVADFSADVTSGTAPLTVNFTDTSTGNVSSRLWDFGDGKNETSQNPLHTYSVAGTYNVSLTVTGSGGSNSKVNTGYIVVSGLSTTAPVANFTANATSGTAPLTVQFTDASTGIVSSYAWDFDSDGNVDSNESNPSHTYSTPGTYSVNLTVSNAGGSDSEIKTNYINVTELAVSAPVAAFTSNVNNGLGPLSVQFTDQSTNSPTAWNWEYNNGSGWIQFSTEKNAFCTFETACPYDIRLTATNNGGSDEETKVHYIAVATGREPLTTVQSGTVSGDLYVSSPTTWASSKDVWIIHPELNLTFTLPSAVVGNIQWAKLYVNTYAGSAGNNYALISAVKFDGNGDGTFETTLGNETMDIASESNWNSYPLNDHINKVFSDYEAQYDVTGLISSTSPAVNVKEQNISGMLLDGRIKGVTLIVAYNDPSSTNQTYYWVNHGNDWIASSGNGETIFNTAGLASGWASAESKLRQISTKDVKNYTFNGISKTGGSNTSNYDGLNTWDVTSNINTGQTSTLAYSNPAGSSYKTTLATLKVKYVSTIAAPVANFTASPTSGNAPLTVQFADESTGTISSYAWDFNNDGVVDSTVQSPSYTYSTAGTYTVNLTVTGKEGSDSEVKTGYITVNTSSSTVATNDLSIGGVVNPVPASAVFAKEANTVTIPTIKNTGPSTLTNISVALYASDVSGPVNTTTIASMASNGTTTVSIIDPTIRNLEGSTVTYTAVVDPNNLISETNESNNNKSSAGKSVKYNGYKGKGLYWEGGSNITTKHTYDFQGNLLYSTQPDTAYKGVGWTTQTETWSTSDLPVPSGSTIEKVFLYFAYNWDQTPGGYPWLNLNFNGYTLDNGNLSTGNGTLYRDWSNFGSYADYEYGLCVYDVTDKFSLSGNSLATNPYDSSYNKVALYPSTLVVIYRNSNETRKQIFVNEECDELGFSDASYGTTSEEATAYAPFTGLSIDKANLTKATLYSFAGSAGPDEGNLNFNGNIVATNAWMGSSNSGSPLVFDATNYITESQNVFGIQSTTSGGMDALQQILVLDYKGGQVSNGTAPVAGFAASVTTGTAPLAVKFTDQSTGSPTSWKWDFNNDGIVDSTEQSPSYTYSSAGTYSVNLTVANSVGSDSEVKTNYITVNGSSSVAPVAAFSATPTSGNAPLTVHFTDASTGTVSSYAWDFNNDGTVDSTEKSPSHTYSAAGTYTVNLTVTGPDGSDSEVKTGFIVVSNSLPTAPVANFTASPVMGIKPLNVQFTDTSAGTPTSWKWSFGDGKYSTIQNPSHIYSKVGKYTVSLTVKNALGRNSIKKTNYVDAEALPIADFSSYKTVGKAPMSVKFTDKSRGNPTSWNWDFGDGKTSTEKNPINVYSAVGKYNVTLTITNAAGTNSTTKYGYIDVKASPVAEFSASSTLGVRPLNVQFTDMSAGAPTSWKWSFGDGSSSSKQNPSHIYKKGGKYTVSLTVQNAAGRDTIKKTSYITVDFPPVASFSASPISGKAPLSVSFTDKSTGYPESWNWDFGDGSTSTEQKPAHIYSTAGRYTVKLTVSNLAGSNTKYMLKYIKVF